MGAWAPFFGREAYTMTLAARLALQSGAALLPVRMLRLPRGAGYAMEILPPVAGLFSSLSRRLLPENSSVSRKKFALKAML